jgi:DNA repair exonuclease SbcCD ATPase subunit
MEPGAETDRATDAADARHWRETAERQRALIEEQASRIVELESIEAELRELRRRLVEAEQELAELPELRRRSEEMERVSSSAEWRIATALRVPRARAEGMWLPALRRRVKQLAGWLIRLITPS